MTVHALHIPTHSREHGPLLDAFTHLQGADHDRKAWATGYAIGYLAGLSDDQDLLDEIGRAANHPMAATHSFDHAAQRWSMLGRARQMVGGQGAFFKSCGILKGWWEGTADRDDAEECLLDGYRLLSDSEGVQCDHGWFCSEDCQRSICEGRCLRDPESER